MEASSRSTCAAALTTALSQCSPISPDEGAATVTYLAVAGTLPVEQDGDYFWLCAPKERAAWHGVANVQAASGQIYNLSLTWVDAN
jgi:hypothetical protein